MVHVVLREPERGGVKHEPLKKAAAFFIWITPAVPVALVWTGNVVVATMGVARTALTEPLRLEKLSVLLTGEGEERESMATRSYTSSTEILQRCRQTGRRCPSTITNS